MSARVVSLWSPFIANPQSVLLFFTNRQSPLRNFGDQLCSFSCSTGSASKMQPDEGERREIGDEGVWSLSSAKPGNGVDQLRDGALHRLAAGAWNVGAHWRGWQTAWTRTGSRTARSRT